MCLACNPGVTAILRNAASRRNFLKYMGVAATSVFTASVMDSRTVLAAAPADGSADVIFKGGTILTMNKENARAEAVAIRGNAILAVGKADDMQALSGKNTRIVDLAGRTLMPGLIDPHMHSTFVVLDDWIDVSPMATPTFKDVWIQLKDGVSKAKSGDWIRAKNFDPSITKDARPPTMAELDALAPDNPFFMMESNGHIAYANSVAMKIVGINQDTPNPSGARYVRDLNGKLSGRLEESAAQEPFVEKMPQPTAAEVQKRIRRLFDHAASVGCTSLHDCGIGLLSGVNDVALLDAVMADNPPVRYRGMLISTLMDEWDKLGIKPGHGNDLFRIDGIKAWADGSNQAETGYQRENYLGSNSRGALNYSLEQITEVIKRAHDGGWQVGVHSNGDAAIDTVIEAYQTVLQGSAPNDLRHRIEHCSVLHPEQMEKMVRLGLSPSFLIGHVRWWGKAFRDRILGPERAKYYDPCASALAAGLRISLHSDWSVTPIEPLRYVQDAVARVMNEGGGVFFSDECISAEAALRAVTIDAAWHCHMDDKVGSLEAGKYADFAILEQDPTSGVKDIGKIKVSETWMAGEQRYTA
ncbi:amidohydrolase [Ochrobactrum sp. SFR4]|uniref:amidohydrolase n=1 Tax=Ochrobactrum sp. SFR4 TaxID=2717368 RepID=UPI001C8BF161|nr:amidohydrolase [Ochrobactrum sp. SFR4]MBX8825124.1 amidohydrolase [Ochrobactrum sp. SFR4]